MHKRFQPSFDPPPLLPAIKEIETVEEYGEGVFVTEEVAEEETLEVAEEIVD